MRKGQYSDNQTLGNAFLGEPTKARLAGEVFTASTLLLLVCSLVFSLAVVGNDAFLSSDGYLYCSFILPQLCFAFALAFVYLRAKPQIRTLLTSQKCAGKYFVIAILLQIGLFGLSEVNALFLEWLGGFGYVDGGIRLPSLDGFGFVGVLFVVAVLPALFEETVFRGVLLNGLRTFGTLGAVLLSGALFALYHQNPAQTLYQFCCGAVFAFVAIRSGSILPTVVSHFINNAVVLCLTKFGVTAISGTAQIVVYIVAFISLVVAFTWLFVFDKQPKKKTETVKGEKKDFFLRALIGVLVCAVSWLSVLFTGIVG